MRKKKNSKKVYKKNLLFRRYFAFTAAIVYASLFLIGTVMVIFTANQWWDEKVQSLTSNAQYVVDTINKFPKEDFATEEEQILYFGNILNVISNATESEYYVCDKNGNIIMCKEYNLDDKEKVCPEHRKLIIPEKIMKRALNNGFSDYLGNDVFGRGKFVVGVPVSKVDDDMGVVFGVESAIDGLVPYILSIIEMFFYTIVVALAFCFVFIYWFSKGITDPLSEMEEVTRHFAKGEFQQRANENYKRGYLSEFAKALNKMADELAINDESQKSFVANVSHELKTPMTTIGGFIDGILDGTIPEEKERDYLTVVSREIKRLSRMVVSMLNLSKIEAGEVSLAPIKYDITSQIFETLLPFERIIEEKNITVEGFEDIDVVYVTADKDLIQQVIYNLFDNAVKFTPEYGKIIIHAENVENKTVVKIKNTGTGVSDIEISRIFERFYKVDKSRSFDVKGVGLGLYIVKTIINMHDGDISASSIENQYIEFSFEIPN